MSEKYYVGKDVTSFSDKGKYKPISRVTLLVDDENSLTAGDDTGMEVVASCPHATQPMVNALLQTMKGYQYQAYEAGAANIDPAAELGDGVTVGGIYSPLSKLSDDGRGYAGISSPGEAEMEDEYPSDGYITQEFNRKIAETRSAITKTSDEIMLKVDGVDGRVTSLSTSIDGIEANISSLNGSITNITADIDGLRTTVSGKIDGSTAQSMIDQSIDEITLKVDGIDGKYTELKATVDGVTITDQSGTTKIKGSSIETASIATNAISADQVNLTGAITWSDLSDAAQQRVDSGKGDDNPSYIHSNYISKTKVISPHVYGGDLYATGQGNTAGTNPAFYMSDGVTGSGASTEPNEPKGWLCYDKNGAGTTQEAQNRVFLHSEPGVALKLDAGGDMSLEADDSIYFLSYLKLRKGVNYGTAAQRDAITPENGQIFWVVS